MGPELPDQQRQAGVGLGPSEDLGRSDGRWGGARGAGGGGEGVCAGVSGAGGSFLIVLNWGRNEG